MYFPYTLQPNAFSFNTYITNKLCVGTYNMDQQQQQYAANKQKAG